MKRLKEMGFDNSAQMRHDAFGNYIDINGFRQYVVSTAIRDGVTSVGVAPRGSEAITTNSIGRQYRFKAGPTVWEAMNAGEADVQGIPARGSYTYSALPADAATIIFNGVTYTYKNTPAGATHVQRVAEASEVGNTALGETLDNLATVLNASANSSINVATYSVNHTNGFLNGDTITVTYDTDGIVGNAYTLDSADGSGHTRSAATLTEGVNATVSHKSYIATLTQSTTDAPTTTPNLNEVGAIVWARSGVGVYTATLAGAFPAAKVFLGRANGMFWDTATKQVSWSAVRTSDNVITLTVKETTFTAANDVVVAAKEISSMTTPLIPVEIIVNQ